MNITFLVGNGFDLNCGLKTSYKDMYPHYIKSPSYNECIDRFKNDLDSNMELWSDFEMALAKYAPKFKSEQELMLCIRDFKKFIIKYLSEEQNKLKALLQNDHELYEQFRNSIDNFYSFNTNNTYESVSQLIRHASFINYNFISFNYTNTLNKIKSIAGSRNSNLFGSSIINVHGMVDTDDIVLGIDNIMQLSDLNYDLTRKGTRTLVKPIFNNSYDKKRVDQAKHIIMTSDIICIFGMSLGESDLTWINCISDWILDDKRNPHLFYFDHKASCMEGMSIDEKMDVEDDIRDNLITKLNIDDYEYDFEDTIHIPIGNSIFNFKNIINLENEKELVYSQGDM